MIGSEEMKRYMKQVLLEDIGINGQIRLKQAKVAVVGAGGLGCPVLQYLASIGVGTIGIIDFDVIDISNLHRQVLYNTSDVGRKKTEVSAERLKNQNPLVNIVMHDIMLDETNAESVLAAYDVVIDGCDNFLTRYIVNDACVKLKKTLVYGSILGYEGQLAIFNYKGSKNLRDIFPEPPDAEDVPSCSENGVLGTVPGIIGTFMAQMAVSVILGQKAKTNILNLIDTRNLKINTVQF
jgi:molybdopterin-synthase adenylyltransferase